MFAANFAAQTQRSSTDERGLCMNQHTGENNLFVSFLLSDKTIQKEDIHQISRM